MILRVERNPNCIDLEPTELSELSPPVEISRVRVRWKTMPEGTEQLTEEYIWAAIWGWSSRDRGSSAAAYAQRVIDPEGDEGVIIYGGDWGLKILVNDEEIGLDVASNSLPPGVLEQLGLPPS
jgi:hypothetical protein